MEYLGIDGDVARTGDVYVARSVPLLKPTRLRSGCDRANQKELSGASR